MTSMRPFEASTTRWCRDDDVIRRRLPVNLDELRARWHGAQVDDVGAARGGRPWLVVDGDGWLLTRRVKGRRRWRRLAVRIAVVPWSTTESELRLESTRRHPRGARRTEAEWRLLHDAADVAVRLLVEPARIEGAWPLPTVTVPSRSRPPRRVGRAMTRLRARVGAGPAGVRWSKPTG